MNRVVTIAHDVAPSAIKAKEHKLPLGILIGLRRELDVYANLLSDQDTRDAQHLGMKQEMTQVSATLDGQSAFIEPEILHLAPGTVEKYLAAEAVTAIHRKRLVRNTGRSQSLLWFRDRAFERPPLPGNKLSLFGDRGRKRSRP